MISSEEKIRQFNLNLGFKSEDSPEIARLRQSGMNSHDIALAIESFRPEMLINSGYYVIKGHADFNCLFWKYNDRGYSTDYTEGRIFSKKEAEEIVKNRRDPFECLAISVNFVHSKFKFTLPFSQELRYNRLIVD